MIVAPGSFFGPAGEGYLRLALVPPLEAIERAVELFHRERARAESFGAAAATYDRLRPSPPAALIDDLVALAPTRVLDIGCGTGKLAAPLAARGLDVLGVEADARMAALAPMPVEIAPFEDWDDRGRTFDLVTCADAWHWLDPDRAEAKLARVARGPFVRLWSFHELDPALLAADRCDPRAAGA